MAKQNAMIEVPGGGNTVLLHTCCAPCSSAIIECLMKNGITPVIYYCNPNIFPQQEYEIRKEECTRYAKALGLEIIDADYDHENWLKEVAGLEGEPERGGRCLKCFKLRLYRTAQYAAQRGIGAITTTLASSRWKSLEQINEAGEWACRMVRGDFSTALEMTEEVLDMKGEVLEMTGEALEMTGEALEMKGEVLEMTEEVPDMKGEVLDMKGEVLEMKGPVWWDQNWRKGGLQERRLQIIKEYNFYNQLYCGCEFSMTSR